MAKTLGPKSALIRETIQNNPDLQNREIAQLINGAGENKKKDKLEVTPDDIAQQKQALKKLGGAFQAPADAPAAKPKGKGGRPKKVVAAPDAAPRAGASASPVALIDRTFALAEECGGIEQLKRLVDRLAATARYSPRAVRIFARNSRSSSRPAAFTRNKPQASHQHRILESIPLLHFGPPMAPVIQFNHQSRFQSRCVDEDEVNVHAASRCAEGSPGVIRHRKQIHEPHLREHGQADRDGVNQHAIATQFSSGEERRALA